jgi:hypothetical protein
MLVDKRQLLELSVVRVKIIFELRGIDWHNVRQ